MPQLDPTYFPSQLFWLVISFMLLYGLVSRFIIPKFEVTLQKRKVQIDDDLKYAEELKREAQLLRDECDLILKTAQDEARDILLTSQLDIKHEIEDLSAKLDQELQANFETSESSVLKIAEGVKKDLESEIGRIVEQVVHQLSSADADVQPNGSKQSKTSRAGA